MVFVALPGGFGQKRLSPKVNAYWDETPSRFKLVIVIFEYDRYRAGLGKNDYHPRVTRIGMKRPRVLNW